MAKRRLSDQQKRRIAANKQELSKDNIKPGTHIYNGTVVSHHGRKIVVETEDGLKYDCKIRQNLGDIACGDSVVIQLEKNTNENTINTNLHGAVLAINDRNNLLEKTGFAGKAKAVATNIGQVVIVCAVNPAPNPYLVDRYLVAIENLPARALIVVNKIDVLDDSNSADINAFKKAYEKIGYQVVYTSIKQQTGIEELSAALQNTTSILVGLSGVGKSSLVKNLLPDTEIRIGETSTTTGEGKHTTTVSSMYHLPDGGSLIDSPGVRDFTPLNHSKEDIVKGFIELKLYQGYCKFSNCTHTTEPGCAINEALEQDELSQQRVNSFRKMLDDLLNPV